MATAIPIIDAAEVFSGLSAARRGVGPLLDQLSPPTAPQSVADRILASAAQDRSRWVIPKASESFESEVHHAALGFSNLHSPAFRETLCIPYRDAAGSVTVTVAMAFPQDDPQSLRFGRPITRWGDNSVWIQPLLRGQWEPKIAEAHYLVAPMLLRPNKPPIVRPYGAILMAPSQPLSPHRIRQSPEQRSFPLPPCPVKPQQVYVWRAMSDEDDLLFLGHSPWLAARYIYSLMAPAVSHLVDVVLAESWEDVSEMSSAKSPAGRPAPKGHPRKRHQRRLPDGRVIWVRATTVGEKTPC